MGESQGQSAPLAERQCVPCAGGILPLRGGALAALHRQLPPGWRLVEERRLEKEFRFKDWREAQAFTNRVGELAEEQNHHPDILLSWGRVKVMIWTHKIDGLTESDFVFAAKADALGEGENVGR